MPFKGSPINASLKIAVIAILIAGLVWAVMGQNYGTHHRVSDPGLRTALALLPFALLAFGLLKVARSRVDLVVLLVCAVLITLSCEAYFDVDELGLGHWIWPIAQSLVAGAALAAVLVRVWWTGRRARQ